MIRGGVVMLDVGDVERAVRFYVETLGMKLVEERPDGSAILDAGEGFLVGLQKSTREAPGGSAGGVTFFPKIPIDEAIAVLENRGVTFSVERTKHFVIARFRDPDANPLCLAQPVGAHPG